jgi:hypothetical protein
MAVLMPDPLRGKIFLETQASCLELETAVCALVVATLRNNAEAAERVRRRAHDVLDHHLDLKIASIAAIRRDIEEQFRRK